MPRRKLPKKRESFYKILDKGGDTYAFVKWEVVRGESFGALNEYKIERLSTGAYLCNCPARKTPCRHIVMLQYAQVEGIPISSLDKTVKDTYIRFHADDKEPETYSEDDIRDIWNVPEEDTSEDYA